MDKAECRSSGHTYKGNVYGRKVRRKKSTYTRENNNSFFTNI
jgi:hypothetical protein